MNHRCRFIPLLWLVAVGCAALPSVETAVDLPPAEGALARGEELYGVPRSAARVRQAALNFEAAEAFWKAARAYAWLVQYGPSDTPQREQDVARGIELARRAIAAVPRQAEGYYYLAVNLGLFSELRAVVNHLPEMAKAGEQAAALDPSIDDAGPYRLLGSLYGFAPEPPISLGDEERGLDYLQKAVEAAPDNPENHFRLSELLAAMDEKSDAKRHLEQALFLRDDDADPTETLAWQTEARRLWEKLK